MTARKFLSTFSYLWLAGVGTSCGGRAQTPVEDSGPACEARQHQLVELLDKLPETSADQALNVSLPRASLEGTFGQGLLLEIAPNGASFQGEALIGTTREALVRDLTERVSALPADALDSVVYVAASHDTDIESLQGYLMSFPPKARIKLVFSALQSADVQAADPDQDELALRVYREPDAGKRQELAEQAYAAYAECEGVRAAVAAASGLSPAERWRQLRADLSKALPQCRCGQLNAAQLEFLLVAEQKAQSGSLGSISAPFMRDVRCKASMPLASVQQLLHQIETFQEEFSGQWQGDALHFEQVLTDERLFNYLCIALPGETLATLQEDHSTLYFKVSGGDCQAFRFEPLSRGAPLGTWRRDEGSKPALAFHYRQGAEELRVFGPAEPGTSPTDKRQWECDQNFHMTGADSSAILLEKGRWFHTRSACSEAVTEEATFGGCVAALAAGEPVTPKRESVASDSPTTATGAARDTAP